MSELLVIIACVYQKGCPEASSHYYQTSPSLQEFVRIQEDKVKKVLAPVIIEYGAPMMLLAVNQEATVKITSNISLTTNLKYNSLIYNKGF